MIFEERTRAYIYRVLLAVQPLIAAYGIASDEQAILWLSLVAAILGTGLASANTSTAKPDAP